MAADLKTIITVPTYWTFPEGKGGRERVSYDHPTPLDREGTLVRLLESLRGLRGADFGVFVIAATAAPELEAAAEGKVEEFISPSGERSRSPASGRKTSPS